MMFMNRLIFINERNAEKLLFTCNKPGPQLSFFGANENIVISKNWEAARIIISESGMPLPSESAILHSHLAFDTTKARICIENFRQQRDPSPEKNVAENAMWIVAIYLMCGITKSCQDSRDKDKFIFVAVKKRSFAQLSDKSHAKETTTATHQKSKLNERVRTLLVSVCGTTPKVYTKKWKNIDSVRRQCGHIHI